MSTCSESGGGVNCHGYGEICLLILGLFPVDVFQVCSGQKGTRCRCCRECRRVAVFFIPSSFNSVFLLNSSI